MEGSAAFRGRRLDEVIPEGASSGSASTNGTSGSGGSAAAASSAAGGGSAFASDATTQTAASLQPRVTVVEGLQSRNGIASISNPGAYGGIDVVEEQGFVHIVHGKSFNKIK
jgi:hypothetical protein